MIKLKCNNLEDTENLAKKFARLVIDGCFVNLYGEPGAGKTAFVKLVAKYLNVQEVVTSPSFVILNEYHSAEIPIYHFDLYRLENVGVSTICEELREYAEGKVLTFVEWADFANGELPFDRVEINIIYGDEDERVFEINGIGEQSLKIIKELENELVNI